MEDTWIFDFIYVTFRFIVALTVNIFFHLYATLSANMCSAGTKIGCCCCVTQTKRQCSCSECCQTIRSNRAKNNMVVHIEFLCDLYVSFFATLMSSSEYAHLWMLDFEVCKDLLIAFTWHRKPWNWFDSFRSFSQVWHNAKTMTQVLLSTHLMTKRIHSSHTYSNSNYYCLLSMWFENLSIFGCLCPPLMLFFQNWHWERHIFSVFDCSTECEAGTMQNLVNGKVNSQHLRRE